MLNPDRIFPPDPVTRDIARRLYKEVCDLPLVCPHGHTEPRWFSDNENFEDPAKLLIIPDHYVLRMLVSQGINLGDLGVLSQNKEPSETDSRKIWNVFAENYHLFRSTPTRIWLDHTFETLFGIEDRLSPSNADALYDRIDGLLKSDAFKPRALFERFNIEVLATTDGCTDPLEHHSHIASSGWAGKVIPTFRPDSAVDPDHESFDETLKHLSELTGEDTSHWIGYLNALRARRQFFKENGATATDHGHPSAVTANLEEAECRALYKKVFEGSADAREKALFRGQMLTEMAGMSVDDGLVMQIHPGSFRNHSPSIFSGYGRDKGFDIPRPENYVENLKPLLDRYGLNANLTVVLFTLDETTYSRELAPLAGVYPALKLGPPWWFHDSPEGMMRFREQATETAGYYNTAGFNDDTRAFPSIPARHDLARRVDCSFLAKQVAQHLLNEDEAVEVAIALSYGLVKQVYKL